MSTLLSIYIPTYNRAHLLESELLILGAQVQEAKGEVELVVSDNCSSDNTAEMILRLQQSWPIKYYRNPKNVGGIRNILKCADLVSGEYTWMLGDDDLVRPGAVKKVLSVLKAHPEVDYVFVNFSFSTKDKRQALNRIVNASDFPELVPTGGILSTDRYLEQWEEMIDPDIDRSFMGALQSSVFRTSLWRQYPLQLKDAPDHSTLETTYPHVVIFAHTLRGRKAYYIGYPYVIAFEGFQSYKPTLPFIYTVIIPQILELYKLLGIEPRRLEKYRRYILRNIARYGLQKMVFVHNVPGRGQFSLFSFFAKYRHYPIELILCFFSLLSPRPFLRPLKRAYKHFHAWLSNHKVNKTN